MKTGVRRIISVEELIGKIDIKHDRALAEFEAMKRHGLVEVYTAPDYSNPDLPAQIDRETDAYLKRQFAKVR